MNFSFLCPVESCEKVKYQLTIRNGLAKYHKIKPLWLFSVIPLWHHPIFKHSWYRGSLSRLLSVRNLCQNANVNLPSSHQHLHIKSEPASPPRDRSLGMIGTGLVSGVTTGGYTSITHGPNESGHSPGDSASSCGSSFEGSEEREDHHGNDNFLLRPLTGQEGHHSPSVKRVRLTEGWTTWLEVVCSQRGWRC